MAGPLGDIYGMFDLRYGIVWFLIYSISHRWLPKVTQPTPTGRVSGGVQLYSSAPAVNFLPWPPYRDKQRRLAGKSRLDKQTLWLRRFDAITGLRELLA